ncbi:MAG: cobalt ECF transporter T component CbiQ [Candidatus Latescibacteria bacterium 4484_7]|nr:MAG: cobalt ECF transporter T component CbiQ [Candidatus Latescibacteria bacterium 4484_7]
MPGFIEKNLAVFSNFIERATLEDESARIDGILQSMDARIKVVIFLAAVIAVSLSRNLIILSILTAAPFVLAPLSRVSISNLARRVFIFIPIFTIIIAVPALFMVKGHTATSLGPVQITSEGMKAASFITLRVTASIAYTMLLLLTTGWYRILKALQSFGLPRTVVHLIAISYRYMHLLIHNLLELLEARRSRVMTRLPFKRNLEIFAHSSAFLFFRSLHLAEEVEQAMESRGYRAGFEETATEEPAVVGAESVFELTDVLFNYPGGIKGIEIDSLKISKGKCTIILGANGSGKSTLLKMLDALIFPERGELRVFGDSIDARLLEDESFRRYFRSRVGLVFQDPDVQCFSPTVFDELAFGPEQKGLDRAEISRLVDEALKMMRIEHLSSRYPYSLSGGEKKRVAIASILTMEPEIYLMDEPTEGLDPSSEGMLIDIIFELIDRGKTLIIATQDLMLARHIGDEAIVLSNEKTLLGSGEIEEILSNEELLKNSGLIHEHRHPHRKSPAGKGHSHYKDI